MAAESASAQGQDVHDSQPPEDDRGQAPQDPNGDTPSEAANSDGPDTDDNRADEEAEAREFREQAEADRQHLNDGNRVWQQVNIYAKHMDSVAGVVNGDTSGTAALTGEISETRVRTALEYYVPPKPCREALDLLRDKRVIVIVGDENIGRRAGAMWLLTDVLGSGPLTSLSPAQPIEAFGKRERAKKRYLLADHLTDGASSARTEFALDLVSQKLHASGGYMVITASTSARYHYPSDWLIDWAMPEVDELFCEYTKDFEGPAELSAKARDMATAMKRPRQVARFLRQFVHDPQAALATSSATVENDVAEWFDQTDSATGQLKHRGRRTSDVLSIAALCFVHAASRSDLEWSLTYLDQAINADRDNLPAVNMDDEVMRQSRLAFSDNRLVDPHGSDGRVRFVTPLHRQYAVAELTKRYGHRELWQYIGQWVTFLAESAHVTVRVRVADGLAAVAHTNLDDAQSLIEPLADGSLPQRYTAAMALWSMSLAEELAPAALETALSWVDNVGQEKALTAAVALGGALGLRYQHEAVRWLCHLSMRGERIAVVARWSLGNLFAAAAVDGADCAQLMRLVCAQVAKSTNQGHQRVPSPRSRYDRMEATRLDVAARKLVAEILTATIRDGRPLIGELATQAELRKPLAAMVAMAWEHQVTRWPAFEAICSLLVDLEDRYTSDRDEAETIARHFGTLLKRQFQRNAEGHMRLIESAMIRRRTMSTRKPQRNTIIALLHAMETTGE